MKSKKKTTKKTAKKTTGSKTVISVNMRMSSEAQKALIDENEALKLVIYEMANELAGLRIELAKARHGKTMTSTWFLDPDKKPDEKK